MALALTMKVCGGGGNTVLSLQMAWPSHYYSMFVERSPTSTSILQLFAASSSSKNDRNDDAIFSTDEKHGCFWPKLHSFFRNVFTKNTCLFVNNITEKIIAYKRTVV